MLPPWTRFAPSRAFGLATPTRLTSGGTESHGTAMMEITPSL